MIQNSDLATQGHTQLTNRELHVELRIFHFSELVLLFSGFKEHRNKASKSILPLQIMAQVRKIADVLTPVDYFPSLPFLRATAIFPTNRSGHRWYSHCQY